AAEAVKFALNPAGYTAPLRASLGLQSTNLSRCGQAQGSIAIPLTPPPPPPAPPPPPPAPPPPAPAPPAPSPAPAPGAGSGSGSGSGGGGGTASPLWLLGLLASAAALRKRTPRENPSE
ncbi:MAG: hypothetical protein K9J82_18710, partial [Methylotenera sp.]|nr:hypothetical protein [Methylotenera sp.]